MAVVVTVVAAAAAVAAVLPAQVHRDQDQVDRDLPKVQVHLDRLLRKTNVVTDS